MQPEESFVQLAEGVFASDYALKNLNKSLGEAQNEFGAAVKGEVNTYGGYKYTPLENIIGAVRPSLTKHHLTVSQFPVTDLERKTMMLFTRLTHWDSGEWIQNALELPGELAIGRDGAAKFNQQTIGGSITYAMKYSYKPIIGIADSEEAIDAGEEKGNLESRPKAQPKPANKAKQQAPPEQSIDDLVAQKSTPAFNEREAKKEKQEGTVSRSSFFLKAKELGWGLDALKSLLKKKYGHFDTSKLSIEQMEESLTIMGKGAPDEVLANLDEPAEAA